MNGGGEGVRGADVRMTTPTDMGAGGAGQDADDPDGELVARIAAGDRAAAAVLLDRHLDRTVRLATRMLNDPVEAEDVAQEVFLRVWKHAGTWRPGKAKFETWIHRVAMNLCYDRLRRKREVITDAPPERPDPALGADDTLHARQAAARLAAAVAELPERQRAAIVLCAYEEKSNIEAAEILGLSVKALESLLCRGRRNLRAALGAQREELSYARGI